MTDPSPCSEPLPPAARDAIRQFNAGEFYAQHDALEALWRAESRPVRRLYQGILQIGVAYYQITRGNRRGALKMLMRGLRWLDQLPEVCQGVDVARLRQDARTVQSALTASPDLAAFDLALLEPVHLLDAP
jgi:predicted metal-dependent hydrolase